jgi:hypothetical protein
VSSFLRGGFVHNQALTQALQNYTFTIKPYTFDNKEMNQVVNGSFTLFVKNTNTGVTESFTQSGTNPITINIEGTSTNDQLKIWQNHPELADYTIIEDPSMAWNAPNIAQNHPLRNWTHGQPFDTLTTTITAMTNTAHQNKEMYIPKYTYTANNQTVTFNGDTVMTMLASRAASGYLNVIKNYKVSHAPHIENFIFNYIVPQNGDINNNSTPLPANDLNSILQIKEDINECATSASGRVRKPVIYTIVNSMDDPAIVAAIARGWDYSTGTWRQTATSPGNGIFIDTQNWRIKNGTNQTIPNSVAGDTWEESFEMDAGSGNAPGNVPSKVYTSAISGGNLVPSTLGHTMLAVAAASNPWTTVLTSLTYKGNDDFNKNIEPSIIEAKPLMNKEFEQPFRKDIENSKTISWNSAINNIYNNKSKERNLEYIYELTK